jgi:hypothetical protein
MQPATQRERLRRGRRHEGATRRTKEARAGAGVTWRCRACRRRSRRSWPRRCRRGRCCTCRRHRVCERIWCEHQQVDPITRTSHYERFAVSGTGYSVMLHRPVSQPMHASAELRPVALPHFPAAQGVQRALPVPGVRSHRRFRKRGTEYVSESGMERMGGSTKRQCDRALPVPCAYRPAAHSTQSVASSLPAAAAYLPASQPMQCAREEDPATCSASGAPSHRECRHRSLQVCLRTL